MIDKRVELVDLDKESLIQTDLQGDRYIRVNDLDDLIGDNLHRQVMEFDGGGYVCKCGVHELDSQEYIYEYCDWKGYTNEFLDRHNIGYSHHIDLVRDLLTYGIESKKVITDLK